MCHKVWHKNVAQVRKTLVLARFAPPLFSYVNRMEEHASHMTLAIGRWGGVDPIPNSRLVAHIPAHSFLLKQLLFLYAPVTLNSLGEVMGLTNEGVDAGHVGLLFGGMLLMCVCFHVVCSFCLCVLVFMLPACDHVVAYVCLCSCCVCACCM